MTLELTQPLPLDTPKGKAKAHFLIDYGHDSNLVFVCFLRDSGECWCFEGPDVRLEANVTAGTRAGAEFHSGMVASSPTNGGPYGRE